MNYSQEEFEAECCKARLAYWWLSENTIKHMVRQALENKQV